MQVSVIDLGPEGVGIEHGRQLTSDEVYVFKIDWRQTLQCKVRVRYTQIRKLADQSGPAVFHTGLGFIGLSESAAVVIDSILIDEVKRTVTEWEANLTGTRRSRLPNLDRRPLRASLPIAYTWHRLVNERWMATSTRDPNQPIDGFALCDDEDSEQIALLRKAYEAFDEEDRDMLRMMAHLSIAGRRA